MKVRDLIEILENVDENANVYIMSQDEPGSDVFIVEGSQVRYGNKAAWDVCR